MTLSYRFKDTHSVEEFWNYRHLDEHLGGFDFHLINSIYGHQGGKRLRLSNAEIVNHPAVGNDRWHHDDPSRTFSIKVYTNIKLQVTIRNCNLDKVFLSNGWEKPEKWAFLNLDSYFEEIKIPHRSNFWSQVPEGAIYSIINDETSAIVKSIIFHPDDARMDGNKRVLLVTQFFDLENRVKEMRRSRRSPGFNNRRVSLPHPHNLRSRYSHSDSHSNDDDDDWYDDSEGRASNDDRSDSMNPNSHAYNPGR
tara:strand:+ start:353 stop:1105 length:753 start_codon:yes stop_codon:yes gene_type:complete